MAEWVTPPKKVFFTDYLKCLIKRSHSGVISQGFMTLDAPAERKGTRMTMDYYLHIVEDGKTSLLQTLRQTIFERHFTAGVRDLTTSLISEQLLCHPMYFSLHTSRFEVVCAVTLEYSCMNFKAVDTVSYFTIELLLFFLQCPGSILLTAHSLCCSMFRRFDWNTNSLHFHEDHISPTCEIWEIKIWKTH